MFNNKTTSACFTNWPPKSFCPAAVLNNFFPTSPNIWKSLISFTPLSTWAASLNNLITFSLGVFGVAKTSATSASVTGVGLIC